MQHHIDILAWAIFGHARLALIFFFFLLCLSMSGGEERRPWIATSYRSFSAAIAPVAVGICGSVVVSFRHLVDSWTERRREVEGRSSRSFLEDAWMRQW
jgi:hypothetical protein